MLIVAGLLAGLWEFPSHILPDSSNTSGAERKHIARQFVTGLFESPGRATNTTSSQSSSSWASSLKHRGELGSVPWVFSHLKLTMHVHVFELGDGVNPAISGLAQDVRRCKWADAEGVEQESMGTGSRCFHNISSLIDPLCGGDRQMLTSKPASAAVLEYCRRNRRSRRMMGASSIRKDVVRLV